MKTILVADKDYKTSSLVRLILTEDMGYKVVDARNGEDAVSKARIIKPDVALVEVFLPDKNGFEVAREIKSSPSLRDTSVVLIVSGSTMPDKSQLTDAFVDDFITKPLQAEELREKIGLLTAKNKNRIKYFIRARMRNKTNSIMVSVPLLLTVLFIILFSLMLIYVKPGTRARSVTVDNKNETVLVDEPRNVNGSQSTSRYDLLPESQDSGIEADQPEETVKGLDKAEFTEEKALKIKEQNGLAEPTEKPELNKKRKPAIATRNPIKKTKPPTTAHVKKREVPVLAKIDTQNETQVPEARIDSLTSEEKKSEDKQPKRAGSISREINQVSMEDIRYKLWNSSRNILGPESMNPIRIVPSRKKDETQNKRIGYHGLKITDLSSYPTTDGMTIIHNVTIENASGLSYKDITVNARLLPKTGQEPSWQRITLLVTVPPRSKRTYLKEGIVIGVGSIDMDASNLEILEATPIQ